MSNSITHIEDLPPLEFLKVLQELQDYDITEKIDGSQVLFGIDDNGFYTSREFKGGKRIYNVGDYAIVFSNTYIRSVHILLENVLPVLLGAGLKPGDQVEAEVLFGSLPNVVPYSKDTNYLIFLRTTEGDVNIDRLKEILDGQSLSISLVTPCTADGRHIYKKTTTNQWKFSRSPFLPVERAALSTALSTNINALYTFLKEKSVLRGIPNYIIESTPLNKCPPWCKPDEWKDTKGVLKEVRDDIRYEISEKHIPDIKSILLDYVVHKFSSKFGPTLAENGWIEGAVLKHRITGRTLKIVDKSLFGVIRIFSWRERNNLTECARSYNTASSFLGELYVKLAKSIGHPELGTVDSKRYLNKIGVNRGAILVTLHNDIFPVFDVIKTEWGVLLDEALLDLSKRLDKYDADKHNYSIQVFKHSCPFEVVYSGNIDNRTKETFASIFEQLSMMQQKISGARTPDDLLHILVGKQLEDLT